MTKSIFEDSILYYDIDIWITISCTLSCATSYISFHIWYYVCTQAQCSTTTKIPPPMESPVMRCHCSEDDNPLFNELGIYILDKLCMFQNMQDYAVTADTKCVLLSVRTTVPGTTHALLAPWTRTSGMHFKHTQTSRTRTSTTTWRDDFMLGTKFKP